MPKVKAVILRLAHGESVWLRRREGEGVSDTRPFVVRITTLTRHGACVYETASPQGRTSAIFEPMEAVDWLSRFETVEDAEVSEADREAARLAEWIGFERLDRKAALAYFANIENAEDTPESIGPLLDLMEQGIVLAESDGFGLKGTRHAHHAAGHSDHLPRQRSRLKIILDYLKAVQ